MSTDSTQAEDALLVYVNGELRPKAEAAVNVFDHGLLYGDGVFEGLRVYNGKIFKLGQHLDRLWASAESLRIEIPVSRDEMEAIHRRCVEANRIDNGYIRLIVTRGVGTLGLNPFKCPTPGIVCIADQIELYTPEMYERGMRVVLAERPRVPVECLDPRIKSLNYLNNILAKIEAIDAGCLECIMFNTQGQLAEGSGDNIFLVKDGELFTPPTTVGVLEGITRRFVKDELCPLLGLDCHEKVLDRDELFAADEIFLTGSAAEMIAVTKIGKTDEDARVIGTGVEGVITAQVRQKFRQIVTSDRVPED
ncbi:MAG: branched-chain-amino-acid transaminase [Planctomycetota bacterium]